MKESHKIKYAKIVKLLATFSSADRLHVGALLLKDGRIISTGYNGHLPGREHKTLLVDNHDVSTSHAEQNTIANCARIGIPTESCELFVTHFPCQLCTKLAIMCGIKKIYYISDYRNAENPFFKEIEMEKIDEKLLDMP
jgi:dCMP deaminase